MSSTGDEHQHAVEGGEIHHLSVSQLKTAALCEARWVQDKVWHLGEDKSKATELGTEVHAQIEHYLKTGQDALGNVARSMLPHLPAPDTTGKELLVEHHFDGELKADGLPLQGYIDVVDLRHREAWASVTVTDHKTTSDIEKYAAQQHQLRAIDLKAIRAKGTPGAPDAGIQMLGYAKYVADKYPDIDGVVLQHIVGQTKGAQRSVLVDTSCSTTWAREQWAEHIDPLARRMRQLAKAKTLDDAELNTNACDKYGWKGCPYRPTCVAYQLSKVPKGFNRGEQTMGIYDAMKRATGNAAGPVAPSAPAATIGATIPAANATVGATIPAPAAQAASAPPPPAPAAPPAEQPQAAAPAPTPDQEPQLRPGESAEANEKPARTRKPRTAGGVSVASEPQGVRLFVNCVPPEPFQPFAGYVAKHVAGLEAAFSLKDLRCAPKKVELNGRMEDHPLAFGGWRGALAAAIKADPPPPGVYAMLDAAGSEIMQAAIEAVELGQLAAVTRGLR